MGKPLRCNSLECSGTIKIISNLVALPVARIALRLRNAISSSLHMVSIPVFLRNRVVIT
jgi:hypothetical protein